MSKSVFISHAVKDKALAREIVNLIEEGMGVPESEIFCSSLDGYGIPNGKNFVTYIKGQLQSPKVVVLLLTPSYFESKFCLSELGAAWIKSHDIFPILVPPLTYADVKDVLLGTQVAKIDDDIKYNELLETLTRTLEFTPKSPTKWDTKRRVFLKAIEPLLKKVGGPSVVSAEEYKKKVAALEEAQAELDDSEEEIRKLKEQLAATEALKDKKDVAAVRVKHKGDGVTAAFNALTEEIKEFRITLKSRAVLKFALSAHYGKPYSIDWNSDREDFEAAERYGFADLEHGGRVVWSKRQMANLKQKLEELDEFVRENGKELKASENDDVPLDPEDQDFWEYHYDL